MSIEWDENTQNWKYDGLTTDEEANYNNPDYESLNELGVLEGQEFEEANKSYNEGEERLAKKAQNFLSKADEFMGYVSPVKDKEYEKLSVGETLEDIGQAVWNEASHLWQKKEDEVQYEARTHIGEAAKYLYRYGAGMFGVGKIGAVLKGVQLAGKAAKVGNVLNKTGKIITADYKFLESAKNGNKLAKAGQIALSGATEGFISDFCFTRPEEGEGLLGDLQPDSNNPIVQYFQTNEMDSGLEYRFKNALQGLVLGTGLNFAGYGLVRAVKQTNKYFKSLKQVSKAETEEAAEQAIKEFRVEEAQLDNIITGQKLLDNVQEAFEKGLAENVEDIERYIYNQGFVNGSNKDAVSDIINLLKAGKEVIAAEDGTFVVKVTKWREAADVTAEELARQVDNDGIALMDETVKDTWTERGWLGENESLTTVNEKTGKVTVNTKAANRIKDQYVNKWQIDNKIDIEFIDGKVNGADGTTQTLEYKGKVVKDKQNAIDKKKIQLDEKNLKALEKEAKDKRIAIDKKKLQIQQIKDKITMLEGGNAEVADPLEVLKKKLGIAERELKDLEYKENVIKTKQAAIDKRKIEISEKELEALENPKKAGNIKILINKNAENPYAILRSELEHARDIAKGEVPKDGSKHFNRYNGVNESEASLGYVKKKADTRAGQKVEEQTSVIKETSEEVTETGLKTTSENLEEFMSNPERTWASVDTVLNDEAYKAEGLLEDYKNIPVKKMSAEEVVKETDDISQTLGYLEVDKNGDIIGILINPNLSKEDAEFVLLHEVRHAQQLKEQSKEVIDLVSNIKTHTKEEFKNYLQNPLEKDADEYAANMLQKKKDYYNERQRNAESLKKDGADNKLETSSKEARNNEYRRDGRVDGTTSEKSSSISREQRSQTIKSTQEADKLLDEVIQGEEKPTITWEVNADNADEIYTKMIDRGITNLAGLKEAISKGDIDYVNMVVSKQLAAERIIGDLRVKLKETPLTDTKTIDEIMDSIAYLTDVSHKLSSAYGRGLNAQKFVGKARSIFSLSSMEEMGLEKLSQLLSVDIKSLNFTRGIKTAKEELYQKMMAYNNGDFLREIFNDTSTAEAFDKYITDMLKNNKTSPDVIESMLKEFSNPIRKRDILNVIEACPENKYIGKALRSIKANGGIDSYIVHNLLSNAGTTIANVLSGGINSVYFPLAKVLGGFISNNGALKSEGWHQLKGLIDTMGESWELSVQAFKSGEGQLISLGKAKPADIDTDTFAGFHAWEDPDWFHKIQNIHSFFTRLMGASDEFLTQMNYRSITRAKALANAEQLAKMQGKAGDMTYIQREAQRQYSKVFNEVGQPLDVQAYAEARDIVYQTPLSGKYYDYSTNNYTQIKQQSALMGVSEFVTQCASKYPIVKMFIPFIRTPANIAQMSLEHNPIYALLSPNQRNLVFGKNVEQREQAIARAKIGMGMASTSLAYGLAMQGFITGSPPIDEKERAALFKTGWRPYSFKVGDKYYSYNKIEPLCTILGFSADMFHLTQSYNPDEAAADNIGRFAQEGMSAILSSTFDKASFMDGMEQFSHIYKCIKNEDDTPVEQVYRGLQMFLPMSAGVTALTTFGESEATTPKGLYETMFNKYGFNKGLGDYKRNIYGERQDIYNLLISTGSKGLGDSIEDEEIQRLAELGWKPTELSNYEIGTSIKYKDFKNQKTKRSFFDAMAEEMSVIEIDGKSLREALADLITTDEYQTSVDGIETRWSQDPKTKKNRIAAVFNEYKKAARNKVIDEQGDSFVNQEGLTAFDLREKDREEMEAERLNASFENTINDIRSF